MHRRGQCPILLLLFWRRNALQDPADYFDCDPDTELCNDTSVSAPAGKCANSFEDCDDPDYLADLHLARVQMPTEYDNWKESNGWSSLYLTIGVYVAILVVLAVLELRYQREQQPSLLKPLTEARSPFGIYLVANVLIGVLIAAAGPPFGIMGMAYSMSPLYGGDSTLRANYPFIEDFGTTKGKAIAWFMVSIGSCFLADLILSEPQPACLDDRSLTQTVCSGAGCAAEKGAAQSRSSSARSRGSPKARQLLK